MSISITIIKLGFVKFDWFIMLLQCKGSRKTPKHCGYRNGRKHGGDNLAGNNWRLN